MKKLLLLTSATLALGVSNIAMADEAPTDINSSATTKLISKKAAPYVFIGVGTAKSDDFPEDSWENYDYYYEDPVNETHAMFRVGFGYEKLVSEKVGIAGELAYNNYGSDESSSWGGGTYTYDYSAIDVLARVNYYFTPKFRGYVKAGIANERVDVSGWAHDNGLEDSSEMVPEFGIGAGYFISESFAADLGYYVLTGDNSSADDTVNTPKISGITLALNYYL